MAAGRRYTRCAEIFKAVLAKFPDEDGSAWTIEKLSDKSSVPVSTLNACRQGTRCLNEESLKAVAKPLRLPQDVQEKFLRDTMAAKQASEPSRERTLREILADPNASLRVEGLRYLPFSDPDQDQDQFVDRFSQPVFPPYRHRYEVTCHPLNRSE